MSLIEEHGVEGIGIEEAAIQLGAARPGAAMDEEDRDAVRIATALVVERVHAVHGQHAGGEGFLRGEEVLVAHGLARSSGHVLL